MDFVIDFIYVGDGDAIVIWAREEGQFDIVFFLDGGRAGNGKKVVTHYKQNIEPHLQENHRIGFINSHPHEDHIDGLLEILEELKDKISFGIYNDPIECITSEHLDKIKTEYLNKSDRDITHLYKSFEQIEKLNHYCKENNVRRHKALRESFRFKHIQILSPSEDYYVNMVQHFSDIDFLKQIDFSKNTLDDIIADENAMPCHIVDEVLDTSPENLTGTVLQLTDSKGRKYILTSDAGVESFNYMNSEGFDNSNIKMIQLPHHGSRGNISSDWIMKFKPDVCFVSAEGNNKHPRRALINCIKRNLPDCKVYSTHTSKGILSRTTNQDIFPQRNWPNAVPL